MKKVLVADDTKNIRLLLTRCLQMEGYSVETAVDGRMARECLLNGSFDLAFMDIKMPYLSGTEVIKQVREAGVDTPVIVITAYATVKNAVECTRMGAVAYLQKPFTADKVKAVLSQFAADETDKTKSLGDTLKCVEELIAEKAFPAAMKQLKGIMSEAEDHPEIYLLLSRVYGELGDKEREGKFLRTYEIFAGKS